MKLFQSSFGSVSLERIPKGDKSLQAWDAADELLLSYLYNEIQPSKDSFIAIFNDAFGTISTSLKGFRRHNISDSYLSHLAAKINFSNNSIDESDVGHYQVIKSTENLTHSYQIFLLKIPKSLAFLEEQLIKIKPLLTPSSILLAAGMTRSIHKSTLELFENIIGPTHTSLAKKKARLIFAENNPEIFNPLEIARFYKKQQISTYKLEGMALNLFNYPAVFSRTKLDIGTRFFLPLVANIAENKTDILDLGCGNGALGLMAAVYNPEARVVFIDESYQAIESAKLTITNWNVNNVNRFIFQANNILEGVANNCFDLVVCNPPFHQDNTIGKQTAFLMFHQAKRVLQKGGLLLIVANRHLQYHHKLERLFGNCRLLDSNKKFVILQAQK